MSEVTRLASGYLPDRPRPGRFFVVLIALFVAALGILFIGTLHGGKSVTEENRAAASWPRLALKRDVITEFPKHFETYFNDHFGGRGQLLALDHWAKAVLFHVSPTPNVLIGTQGWLYFLGEDARSMERWRRGSEPFSDAE